MDPQFCFEGGSSDEEQDREEKICQSPWEFGSYSESVYDEHERRRTTSVDAKISKALQIRPVSLPNNDEEEDEDQRGHDNNDSEEDEDGDEDEEQKGEEEREGVEEHEGESEHEEEDDDDDVEDESPKQRPCLMHATVGIKAYFYEIGLTLLTVVFDVDGDDPSLALVSCQQLKNLRCYLIPTLSNSNLASYPLFLPPSQTPTPTQTAGLPLHPPPPSPLLPTSICIEELEWNFGFVHDDRGQVDILQSPFFDVGFDFDDTVEEYIDRIQYDLVDVIDEQRSKGRWIIYGHPPPPPIPVTSPATTTLRATCLLVASLSVLATFIC
ncbi:hypothetical protein IEQ34_015209 [Dendrobium chrysotoxum]|uniref:Uncharacterized protein n=1 Tax=Dendrobium chrysotoxum TaxID=161865 RepID=A0AAV7GI69_DENCH|nr:hypothetical protein IEQ34_015209 [Dendrobium chrysotoxum]